MEAFALYSSNALRQTKFSRLRSVHTAALWPGLYLAYTHRRKVE